MAADAAPAETAERVLPLEVRINGVAGGIWPILFRAGVLYAPTEAFSQWRIQLNAGAASVTFRSLPYTSVASAGITNKLNEQTLQLDLTVPPEVFAASKFGRDAVKRNPAAVAVPALFVNYDFNYSRTWGSSTTSDLGLLGEVGTSGPIGVFTQTFAAQNLLSTERELVRLLSAYRYDFPEAGYTFTAGDATQRTGLLGRASYFGGVQFGTNFSLAPLVYRQPIPVISGETGAPSVVQLYVNNVLRQTSRVPAGPFTLDNLPPLIGSGEVSIRVRDMLGRESVTSQPFLVSGELLAPGLNDWSVEAGTLRRGLGGADSGYGAAFASGFWRRGLSAAMTAEARADVTRTRSLAGAALTTAVGASWLARTGMMVMRDTQAGYGGRWMLGADRAAYTNSFNVTLEGATRGFRFLSEDTTTLPIRLQLAAQASVQLGTAGRLGVGVTSQRLYDQPSVSTITANYTTAFGNDWQFNAFLTRAIAGTRSFTMGVGLAIPMGRTTTSNSSVQVRNGGGVDAYSTVTHAPDGPYGFAWRGLTSYQQGQTRAEGGLYYMGRVGQVNADVSLSSQQSAVRVGANGGLLFTGGSVYGVTRFDSGAALVEVPGYANVGVGTGGNVIARTDASGIAMIPRLQSFLPNPVRLDPNDLPLSAEVETIELDAIPAYRSVARVTFPVRGGRGALLRIIFDDGEPAPAGATVHIPGDAREFYVARKGEAYVTGMKDHETLRLHWKGGSCALDINLPPAARDDIPRLGPLRCSGVHR